MQEGRVSMTRIKRSSQRWHLRTHFKGNVKYQVGKKKKKENEARVGKHSLKSGGRRTAGCWM